MRSRIKALAERALGVRILRELPPGLDVCHDLRRLSGWSPDGLLFDVGANVGQTTLALAAAFPEAPICAFEPAPAMFAQLEQATHHLPRVRRFHMAFGPARGTAQLFLHRKPDQNTLRGDLGSGAGFQGQGTVTVEVGTIDDFLQEQQLAAVQLLKIDTEGYDLEVLKGAARALESGVIGAVEVEAGFGQDEGKFVALEEFRTFLQSRDYQLLGLYEQVQVRRHSRLRRCNAVFVHDRLAEPTPTVPRSTAAPTASASPSAPGPVTAAPG